MKKLILLTFCGLLASAPSGRAVAIDRDFDLAYTSGPLAGQSFSGAFSYDDANLTGLGFEILGPVGGVQPEGFLAFEATVDGASFTLSDDYLFPNFPLLSFFNGVLTGFDYIGVSGSDVLYLTSGQTFYFNPDESAGTFSLRTSPVPEHGNTWMLLTVTIVVLMWWQRLCHLAGVHVRGVPPITRARWRRQLCINALAAGEVCNCRARLFPHRFRAFAQLTERILARGSQ